MKLRHSIGLASLIGLALAGPTLAMDARFKDANGDTVNGSLPRSEKN